MAGKSLPMNILKQLLLKLQQGQSKKQMARELGISRNTLKHYLALVEQSSESLAELVNKDEFELYDKLQPKVSADKDHRTELETLFPWMEQELSRVGVTRFLLWGEYRNRYPKGYSYSQFCWHFQQWRKTQQVSMIIPHEAGDKVYIDFAGKKLRYHDLKTEQDIEVEVFVSNLGYSQYSFACAVATQNSEDFLWACRQMLEYFAGSPRAIVCDNLKAGVTKASRYEPDVNRSFSDFCNHYQMAIIPTRVAKPKDKSLVEGLVQILYNRIYGPLRNHTFYSLEQINLAMKEQLLIHNRTPMAMKDQSRFDMYENEERKLLKPLPEKGFELKHYTTATVQKNSHIVLSQNKHYYSVPMRYIGKKVNVIYTASSVSVYYQQQLIAFHARSRLMHKYTTIADHLPSQHNYQLGLSPSFFINWAKSIDNNVARYIELLIESKSHPEQAYKSCQGIQSIARKLGNEKLKEAVSKGLELEVYNYMFIKNRMEKKDETPASPMPLLPLHDNIRGAQHYQ